MPLPRWGKRVARGAGVVGVAAGAGYALLTAYKIRDIRSVFADVSAINVRPKPEGYLPYLPFEIGKTGREVQIKYLQETPEYDVLVIGGGCTGSGVALDAVSRGLKTALVEADDFGSGTSSRSTKLIHGGVRYLQKAIFNLDIEQYKMVKEALQERANLLDIAPHLSKPLPIMLPVYRWWQIPYFWAGIKAYDFVAGRRCVKSSYLLSKERALELFPMLKSEKLCGAIVYYDGQHNDARMNLAITITAARLGANTVNHVKCIDILKENVDGKEVVRGARLKDVMTGAEWNVRCKCLINATGPFTDSLRQMDDKTVKPICQPSSGIHIVLPDYYSPSNMGLLDPNTSDGRVIFFLPWEKVTLAGTTDSPCEVTAHPVPAEKEIQFILKEIRGYLDTAVDVRRGDVLSAWSGIRPLVVDPNKKSTQEIARNHIIHVSPSNMVTIAGGKWTTYRLMAEETVDAAIKACDLKPTKPTCQTMGLILDGGHEWSPTMYIRLVQDFGLENEVAQHLSRTYGDRAYNVGRRCKLTGRRWPVVGKRLHEDYPYLEEEVNFAITREYACTAVDVIARRMRLAFINTQAAFECLPRIVDLMAEELKWSKAEKKAQFDEAMEFLNKDMGRSVQAESRNVPINFSVEEINKYLAQFKVLDKENKGYITLPDIRRQLKSHGDKVTDIHLHEVLNEVDMNRNGQIDVGEYLQFMSAMKTGAVSSSRFAKAMEVDPQQVKVNVNRSGGGL
ncbi:Glycerol-3-phosphate dehydrogenase, mitochondrial [Hypsibius exemplaris]|uniref:Glycerol-3-phosphate dehydrogenase n=1 Tax=Hypsibius exemplaris TaxID=2072580 RepID=A0A9X6NEE5_HYPEX|nr:Glycerol-3-phosphate dehydrogenase, mitochondrial [Hypsibius exemplaris]